MAILLVTTGCGHKFFHKWSKPDKILYGTATGLFIADAFQTRYIMSSNKFDEKNPIIETLGPQMIYPYFAGCAFLTYLIADSINGRNRTEFLKAISIIELYQVEKNLRIGIGFKF